MAVRLLLLSTVLLAGCAARVVPVAVAPPPPAVVAAPPAPTPINAGLSAAATLWHLRAGLNVAALACRGPDEAALAAGYNALLATQADALKAAQAAEFAAYQAGGGDWRDRYDDDQTRLYNFFGQARGRDAFCRAASAMVARPPATLTADAAAQLALLDRSFAPPRLEVDARVLDGPARVMVAAR